ncbi:MAG: RluA family pseudouridine synthase [Fluviicola sp.]
MIVLDSHIVQVDDNIRFVDYAIGMFPGFETRNAIKKGIKKNRFLINGEKAKTGTWVKNDDRIDLLERSEKPKVYNKEIEVVFEDDYLAVVHKPAGLIVSGNQFKTLENCLIDRVKCSKAEDALEWALPVHRLDAPTSGLVIFAKTISSRRRLGEMLANKGILKMYHAVVHGIPKESWINQPIDGKVASSNLKVIQSVPSLKNEHLSLIQLEPITGRTHQLRIHCQYIGNSIVGDQKYVSDQGTFKHKGLFLSATQVLFQHPITNEKVNVEIPVPAKFFSLLQREARRVEKFNSNES